MYGVVSVQRTQWRPFGERTWGFFKLGSEVPRSFESLMMGIDGVVKKMLGAASLWSQVSK